MTKMYNMRVHLDTGTVVEFVTDKFNQDKDRFDGTVTTTWGTHSLEGHPNLLKLNASHIVAITSEVVEYP